MKLEGVNHELQRQGSSLSDGIAAEVELVESAISARRGTPHVPPGDVGGGEGKESKQSRELRRREIRPRERHAIGTMREGLPCKENKKNRKRGLWCFISLKVLVV